MPRDLFLAWISLADVCLSTMGMQRNTRDAIGGIHAGGMMDIFYLAMAPGRIRKQNDCHGVDDSL